MRVEELASELVFGVAEHLRDLANDLFERLLRRVGRLDSEPGDLVVSGSAPDAELEASVGEVVHHRHALCDAVGMVDLRVEVPDRRAQMDALGHPGGVREKHLGRRQVRVLVQEVMLRRHAYLKPDLSAALMISMSPTSALCSKSGSEATRRRGT